MSEVLLRFTLKADGQKYELVETDTMHSCDGCVAEHYNWLCDNLSYGCYSSNGPGYGLQKIFRRAE